MLVPVTDDIWRVDFPLSVSGIRLGGRMIVLRESDQITLYSPSPMPIPLKEEIEKLGTVTWLIAPNLRHHLYLEKAHERFPEAKVIVPQGLEKKIKNLAFDGYLPHEEISGSWQQILVEGAPFFNETVIYDPKTKTLVCADFIQYFESSDHSMTRMYLNMNGIMGQVGFSKLIRSVYKDRSLARASVDRILELEIDRILQAHGSVIEGDVNSKIKTAYSWL